MYSSLATVRGEAATIVVGTLSTSASGLSITVEYALRGNAAKGPWAIKDSPDGHVTVDLDPAKNRVVGFVDAQRRLRWVGRLVAGPSLERGVIRLEGFFDRNAHIVEPELMTLAQLRGFLADGQLVQTYRATLAFRDGKGGIAPSSRRFFIDYDAMARNTTVRGLAMACLDDGRLQSPSWGDVRLLFYCNDRARTLHLAGFFTGVDAATGELLVTVVPTQPFLDQAEFDRYVADATATNVQRRIEIVVGGKVWTWLVGADLVGPDGRVHAVGGSSNTSRRSGTTTATLETHRFAHKVSFTLAYTEARPPWMPADVFVVQLADGKTYTDCRMSVGDRRALPCTLRSIAPTVEHARGWAQRTATEADAILVAERFIVGNGYTDQSPMKDLANLTRESLEPIAVSERLALRHHTLEARAFAVAPAGSGAWFVVFRYQGKPNGPGGRAVLVTAHGRAVRIEHQDFVLARARPIRPAP